MELGHTKSGVFFDTAVEEWMSDLYFTEVMNLAMEPPGTAEQEITRALDHILYEVMYGTRLDDVIARIQSQPSKLIKGRLARKGEQALNTAMGNAVDSVFKTIVESELLNGRLKPYQSQLTVTPCGVKGPDLYRVGSPMIAWDVTTRDSSSHHVVRDNFQRGWNRYYLLIWDDPGTGFLMPNGMVQRLPRRV